MVDPVHRGQLRVELVVGFREPPREAPAGYEAMPLTDQWPSGVAKHVDKATWRPCHACAQVIPMRRDRAGEGALVETWSYICPACDATQRGSVHDGVDPQKACHGCKAALAGDGPCAACGMLRGWAVASCPWCRCRQAVCMPHLASMCDGYTLECYGCETVTRSLCIC